MKPLLSFFCLLCLSFGTLQAQSPDYPQNNYPPSRHTQHPNHVLLSPFHLFDGTFMLSYERLFNTGALRISPSVTLRNNRHYYDYGDREEQGWALDFGYKFFFTNRVHKVTPYVGPYIFYRYLESKIQDWNEYTDREYTDYYPRAQYTNYDILGVGVEGGVKFIFGRFTMDVSLGGGVRIPYRNGKSITGGPDDMWDIEYKGVVARGNFSFGISF